MNSASMGVLIVGLASILAAPSTLAVEKARYKVQLASSICHPINPAKDEVLRRNLNGLRNNDVVNVSVSCTLQGDEMSPGLTNVFVYFRNTAGDSRTVGCSLVTGIPFYGQSTFSKSFVMTPGLQAAHFWEPTTDFPAGTKYANLQCAIPPGVVMSEIGLYDLVDVGA